MYGFRNFGEGGVVALPSIQTVFNGVNLDKLFQEKGVFFRTTGVEGRGSMAKEVRLFEVEQRNGSIYDGASYPSRSITVRYMLKGRTNEELRRMYEVLNDILKEEQKKLYFTDDIYYFTATFSGASSQVEESNTLSGELNFTCEDPFKYTENTFSAEGSNLVTVPDIDVLPAETSEEIKRLYNGYHDGVPPLFEFTLDSSTSNVYIRNIDTGKVLHLSGSFSSGDIFSIDFTSLEVVRNGQSAKSSVVIDSNFEDFIVRKGDEVQVEPISVTYTVTVRGKAL